MYCWLKILIKITDGNDRKSTLIYYVGIQKWKHDYWTFSVRNGWSPFVVNKISCLIDRRLIFIHTPDIKSCLRNQQVKMAGFKTEKKCHQISISSINSFEISHFRDSAVWEAITCVSQFTTFLQVIVASSWRNNKIIEVGLGDWKWYFHYVNSIF